MNINSQHPDECHNIALSKTPPSAATVQLNPSNQEILEPINRESHATVRNIVLMIENWKLLAMLKEEELFSEDEKEQPESEKSDEEEAGGLMGMGMGMMTGGMGLGMGLAGAMTGGLLAHKSTSEGSGSL